MKLSLLLLMFLCVFNMIGAGTRGAVIAFGVSLLVLFRFMDIPRKGLILAIAIVLIIATFLFMQAILPELVIERYYDPSVGKGEQTFKVRILMTIKALEMFPEHPIIGHGPHGFIIETRAEPGYRFANVHNGYLQVLTSLGLLGLGICALIFIILFRSLLKLVESLSGKYRYLSIAALGWFAGYCVYMLNDPAFFHDYHWYLIGLIVAFCSIQERIEGRRIVL
jgi:O-antigen ligase